MDFLSCLNASDVAVEILTAVDSPSGAHAVADEVWALVERIRTLEAALDDVSVTLADIRGNLRPG